MNIEKIIGHLCNAAVWITAFIVLGKVAMFAMKNFLFPMANLNKNKPHAANHHNEAVAKSLEEMGK